MAKVELYTTDHCGHCVRAKLLLEQRGIPFEEIRSDRARLEELTGGWTFPQVVIDGRAIGGYDELVMLDRSGALAALLA
jgi:glutaredoxin 3